MNDHSYYRNGREGLIIYICVGVIMMIIFAVIASVQLPYSVNSIQSMRFNTYLLTNNYVMTTKHSLNSSKLYKETEHNKQIDNKSIIKSYSKQSSNHNINIVHKQPFKQMNVLNPQSMNTKPKTDYHRVQTAFNSSFDALNYVYTIKNKNINLSDEYKQFQDQEEDFKKLPLDLILDENVCYSDYRTFTTRSAFAPSINQFPIITDAFGDYRDDDTIVTVIINLKHVQNQEDKKAYFFSTWSCIFTDPDTHEEQISEDMFPKNYDTLGVTKVLKCRYPFSVSNFSEPIHLKLKTSIKNAFYPSIPCCIREIPKTYKYYLSTCVMMQYHSQAEIIKWLLYKRYQGFEHITIYANEPRERYYRMLRSFIQERYVDIIDWNFNQTQPFISQESQLADCIHRYRGVSKYLSLEDVDEFFQPLGEYSKIVDVVKFYESENSEVAGIMLHNWFFKPKEWFSQTRYTFFANHWPFDKFIYSMSKHTPPGRQKIIIVPDLSWTMTPHQLGLKAYQIFASDTTEMRSVHYKWYFSSHDYIEDTSMSNYVSILQPLYDDYINAKMEDTPEDYFYI